MRHSHTSMSSWKLRQIVRTRFIGRWQAGQQVGTSESLV